MPTAKFNDLPETQRTALTEQFFQNFQFWDELVIDVIKIAFMDIFGDEPGTAYSIGGGNEYFAVSGTISYQKGFMEKIRANYSHDEELVKLAQEWRNLQRRHFYKLSAKCSMCRENTSVTAYNDQHPHGWSTNEEESEVNDIIISFNHWALKQINEEFKFQTAPEAVADFYGDEEIEIE